MKEGFDNEIDSLLRRRARGAVKPFANGEGAGTATSAHLDADELGAFAEGALPSPARLAAASHLADCDRCREVAVTLSRALGGTAEVKQAAAIPASDAVKKPASWGAWVAALFSPRVLRYAGARARPLGRRGRLLRRAAHARRRRFKQSDEHATSVRGLDCAAGGGRLRRNRDSQQQ
jgi:hypothetical protein